MDVVEWLVSGLGQSITFVSDMLDSAPIKVLKWAFAAFAVYYTLRLLWPTWRILALSLYRDLPSTLLRSLFADVIKLNPLRINREKWYRAARVRVEWELLRPRPQPPARHHALPQRGGSHPETAQAARERYRKEV